jgi:hypothetical protein
MNPIDSLTIIDYILPALALLASFALASMAFGYSLLDASFWYADIRKSFSIHRCRMVFLYELIHMGNGWDLGFDDESMSRFINVQTG